MQSLLPLLVYCAVGVCTPGPNNLMVLSSGANFGLPRTVPHILGIAFGFPVMAVGVGLGVRLLFEAYPVLHTLLLYVTFAFILWLAWQILRAGRPEAEDEMQPLTFFQAAAFQWINPKAWAMVFGATGLFLTPGGNTLWEVGIIALTFGALCVPNGVVWALFGGAIAGALQDDRHRRWFNGTMAALLVVSALPGLF
jgi:threonine/homoserine/homoserine lactone efflux protein